jgi:hypothetical protein
MILDKLNKRGTPDFIYHYGYFYQVIIIPLREPFILSFTLHYGRFIHDIQVRICSYDITDYRQY